MITKEYDTYKLICDDCLQIVELDSWNESLRYAKDNGWKTEKLDGEGCIYALNVGSKDEKSKDEKS